MKNELAIQNKQEAVQSKIMEIRGQRVLLDRDVAELYGVETKMINQAVRRNPDKFPYGYTFVLDNHEVADLRSQNVTATLQSAENKPVTFSHRNQHNPVAFTEKGLYMLATILKSPQAVATTLAIIETFTQVRELVRTMNEMQKAETEQEQKSLMKRTGEIISEVVGNQLDTTGTETEFELNFAVFKLKHTVKKSKPSKAEE